MKILRLLGCLLAASLTAVGQTNIVGSGFNMGSTSGSSGGSGTVTSVGLTIGGFTVTGSPVINSGTLAATLASPVANGIVVSDSSGNLSASTATMVSGNTLKFAGTSMIADDTTGALLLTPGTGKKALLQGSLAGTNAETLNSSASGNSGLDFYNNSGVFQGTIGYGNASASSHAGQFFLNVITGGAIHFSVNTTDIGTWAATLLTANEGLSVAGTAYSYGAPVLNGASGLLIPATTYTLTGTSGVTNFGSVTLNIPNYTNPSSNTISNLATLLIIGAPTVAGSQVGTTKYSIDVLAGNVNFGGAAFVQGTLQVNGASVLQNVGAGNVTSSGAVLSSSASGGTGYTTGAGGAVTQLTSRSTGVTLNTVTGAITGINTSLAATTAVTFTVTDSAVAATDKILVHLASGGSVTTSYYCSAVAAGSFNITLYNENTVTADTTTPVMGFEVLKGSSN